MSDKTVTLSDGSVWEYRTLVNGQKLWACDAEDRGTIEPSRSDDEPLTASDHRAIADVLDPAPPLAPGAESAE